MEELICNDDYNFEDKLFSGGGCFGEVIFHHINNNHENKMFVVDGISGRSKRFNELCHDAKVLSSALRKMGISSGNTIAISCENRLEYPTVMLSSIFSGTVFAPINPTYSKDEIVHAMNISKPSMIFCSGFTLNNISLSLPYLEKRCIIVLLDEISPPPKISVIKYKSMLQNRPIERLYQSKYDEVALILTSSGTTGLPKGVMLSYANLKYISLCAVSSKFMNLQPNDIILGLLPLFHGYGYLLILASILTGIKIVLLPKFEERLFLSTIQKFKISNLYLVPPLMVFLGKHPLVTQYNLSSVRKVVCGAAPLSNEVIKEVHKRLPQSEICQGYGMTETSVVITVTPPNSNNPHSVGKLAAGLQVKVLDTETGKALPRGQPGEICVRGPCVMVGYCNDPQATRHTIDFDGWLHTGDVGYVDSEGFFYIIDRIKELIKYKGFQVAPAELESLLMGMSGIKDAAVIGLPDTEAGELPMAYVVLQPNTSLTGSDIMKYINSQVSPHKRLRVIRFIDSIPRNPSGKILRKELRKIIFSKL